MALQDLTPQLRTRLSRMEKAVGWFVLLATALLAFGFAYYVYNTAASKGWFIQKVRYQTSLDSATGLKVGDPVTLMGFPVGSITRIEANAPGAYYGLTVYFSVKKPYYGYIWSDSAVKVSGAGFLGSRQLEVTKGSLGVPTVFENTNKVTLGVLDQKRFNELLQQKKEQDIILAEAFAGLNIAAKTNPLAFYFEPADTKPFWLEPAESPAITERLDGVMDQVEKALPGFLQLTNDLALVLQNSASATSNLNVLAAGARPLSENLTQLSAQLRGPGALGEWLLAPQTQGQIDTALTNVNTLLTSTDTNLNRLVIELGRSLDNMAGITSNLNSQVQANTNLVKEVSDAIVHADELMQGLKRHWLLRSAFRPPKTNAPPSQPSRIYRAPNDPFRK